MDTTAIITFREFLEAFLIIGVFLGMSKKLHLKKEIEITLAAGIGFAISISLAIVTYFFGDYARGIFTEEGAEILESYLLIFSGFFIAYVVFSLHNILRRSRGGKLINAHKKLQNNAFDFSLFLTIILIVAREGFEIALFTASTSLFSTFIQNVYGLSIGFTSASVVGIATYITYVKFPIEKIFKTTEYIIVLLGASFVQNGATELLKHSFNINIGSILRFPLEFLPQRNTIIGHLLSTLTGIDREFSVARLTIMVIYISFIYIIFFKKDHQITPIKLA